MMNLMEVFQHRRSVRKYTGEHIPEEALRQVLQAGLLSPSGRARRPWEFIVVRDRDMLNWLAQSRPSAGMLSGADCAIVVLGDEDKTDTWPEDCSIAMSNMHLMADALGLGSCWIQGRIRNTQDGRQTMEDYLRQLLHFPEHCRLEAILSLGIPQSHPAPQNLASLEQEKIHLEQF